MAEKFMTLKTKSLRDLLDSIFALNRLERRLQKPDLINRLVLTTIVLIIFFKLL